MIPFLVLDKIKAHFGNDLALPSHIDRLLPSKEGWQGSEHDLQVKYFAWLAELRLDNFWLHLAHAVPNGGKRDAITAAGLVAEGVKSGILDVSIPIPRQLDYVDYHGFYLEFKRKGEKPTEDQRAIALMLASFNYKVIVTNCLEIAKEETSKYLGYDTGTI